MSFSSYNPNDRYRQRAAQRTMRLIIFTFFFSIVFGAGFWAGGLRSKQDMYILQEEKRIIGEERDKMQAEAIKIRAEAQTATVRLEQLKTNYDELFGDGPMKNLVELLRKQLDQGVDDKRLESVILSARPPQNCSDPQSKRIIISTPVYKGPSSKAVLPKGVVVITGKGQSTQNSKGQKEAWFDTRKPIELSFKIKGGRVETKKGILPLYHSVITGDKEYRFTIKAGNKSFVKITYDYCDYP